MNIKLTKGFIISHPTRLGATNFSFESIEGEYLGSINGQELSHCLEKKGYIIVAKLELENYHLKTLWGK